MPAWIRDHLSSLKGAPLAVYCVYASRANHQGQAWPSIASLRHETGFGERTIQAARSSLVEHGFLRHVAQKRQGGRFGTDLFEVVLNKPNPQSSAAQSTEPQIPHRGGRGTKVTQGKVAQIEETATVRTSSLTATSDFPSSDSHVLKTSTPPKEDMLPSIKDCRPTTVHPSSTQGRRTRSNSDQFPNHAENIRRAYAQDVAEDSFAALLNDCDDQEDRSHWNSLYLEFKQLFPEWKKPKTQISAGFAITLLEKFEVMIGSIKSGNVSRGNFCSKVIDEVLRAGDRYDPDFQKMRKLLRKQEESHGR